ncbi:hypothetical protein BDZ45DRAFT_740517 [Acephala macrosclerotiorum]|nr:hypothetical protein BDZ45DRAFT_740517 [Acephala macrosclerotiorum]
MTFAGYLFRQVFVHPHPIPSDVNLIDQTVLITGANPGIGLEAACQCVRMKAKTVILAARSSSKATETGHPTRLTVTSSEVHMWTPFKGQKAEKILNRLNEKEFSGDYMDRYSVTKLVNIFFIKELAPRVDEEKAVVNLINPRSMDTGLDRDGNKFIQAFDRVVGRTREEGYVGFCSK